MKLGGLIGLFSTMILIPLLMGVAISFASPYFDTNILWNIWSYCWKLYAIAFFLVGLSLINVV